MGSFNQMCAISGLPITYGDKVRFFLLSDSPYTDSSPCSSNDLYFPRSYPLQAAYNDYGSIEDYDKSSPGVFAIQQALRYDLVEVGVGDNSVHDVATSVDMSFEDLLRALWEERVVVRADVDTFKLENDKFKELLASIDKELKEHDCDIELLEEDEKKEEEEEDKQPWLPTLKKVKETIEAVGFTVVSSGMKAVDDNCFLVDEKSHGWVRVRQAGYGGKDVSRVLPALKERFAAMITAGSGNYSDLQEIQVMPKAGAWKEHRSFGRNGTKKTIKVRQAMILEEVWQEAIQLSLNAYNKSKKQLEKNWKAWDKYREREKEHLKTFSEKKVFDVDEYLLDEKTVLPPRSPFYDMVPFTVSLETHHKAVISQHKKKPFSEEQIAAYIENVAGFVALFNTMMPMPFYWRPSYPFGPQETNYSRCAKWHGALANICKKSRKKL